MNISIGTQFYYNKLVWTITDVHNKIHFRSTSKDDEGRRRTRFDTERFISSRLIDYNNLPKGTQVEFNGELYEIGSRRTSTEKGISYYCHNVKNTNRSNWDFEPWIDDFRAGVVMVHAMPDKHNDIITAQLPKNRNCQHKNKYLNILSVNMKFWVCKDCGKDLGNA